MKQAITLFTLCVLTSVAFGGRARAEDTVPVLDERSTTTDDPYSVNAKFVVNDELGRAWVEVEIDGGYVDADLHREEVFLKRKLPGLSYEASSNRVLYRPPGAKAAIVCGAFSPGNLFKSAVVHPTGHCPLMTKVEKRPYDDGYHVQQKAFVIVSMTIEGASSEGERVSVNTERMKP